MIYPQKADTLNVFNGVNTVHRATPLGGDAQRIKTVLTYLYTSGRKSSTEVTFGVSW